MLKRLIPALCLSLLAALLSLSNVQAQNPTPLPITDNQVNDVAADLFCPVCENIPLDVCPTQACAQWRELIRLKLSEGWSSEQIKSYFAQQYGDRVLGVPPAVGLNLLVYILPPLVLLAGIVLVVRVLRAGKTQSAALPRIPPPASSDPYIRQLEEELKKRN
jgi:cytochrome c-type biogenesis protein CcmH